MTPSEIKCRTKLFFNETFIVGCITAINTRIDIHTNISVSSQIVSILKYLHFSITISEQPTTKQRKNPARGMQCANGTFDEAVDIFSLTCTEQSRVHDKNMAECSNLKRQTLGTKKSAHFITTGVEHNKYKNSEFLLAMFVSIEADKTCKSSVNAV